MTKVKSMKLRDVRKQIDLMDEKILQNMAERIRLVKILKVLKNHSGLSIEDKSREEKVMKHFLQRGKKLGIAKTFIVALFKLIIRESKRIQKTGEINIH